MYVFEARFVDVYSDLLANFFVFKNNMGGGTYVLYEAASGYAFFEVVEAEAVGSLLDQVQQSVLDPKKFCSIVKLTAFQPLLLLRTLWRI